MNILLIGCGKMGSAMLSGWLKSGIPADNIKVVDPFSSTDDVECFTKLEALTNFKPDYVIVAVKPQMLEETLPDLKRFDGACFVSIAAGKKIKFFARHLDTTKVVRAMPNLAALIGEGVTGIFTEDKTVDKADIEKMFTPLGNFLWLESEDMVDSITAISGSGPAYVFLFIQSLIDAARELGFNEKDARDIATQTVLGAANTVKQSSDTATTLKENVTSKGGTTAAALAVLEDQEAMGRLIQDAAKAAFEKSKELSE